MQHLLWTFSQKKLQTWGVIMQLFIAIHVVFN